jgi:hypothetical protein
MTTHRRTRPGCSAGLASVPPGAAGCKTPPSGPRRRRPAADRSTSLQQPAISIAAVHERCLTSAPPRLSCTHPRTYPRFQYRHRSLDRSVRRGESLWSWGARTACRHGAELSSDAALIGTVGDTGERRRACRRNLASSTSNGWSRPLCSACWAVGAARRCDTPGRTPCLPE